MISSVAGLSREPQHPHDDRHQVMRQAVERGDGQAEGDFTMVIQDLQTSKQHDGNEWG
jgi:hypothetical protein